MQYIGSKKQIAKYILPVMLYHRKPGQLWVEPFVGGANLIDKVQGPRWGNDDHIYLVALLKSLQEGYVPPTSITKEEYHHIKQNPDIYPPELVGFVGFLCSFGGKWWRGYAYNNSGVNYADRGSRCLVKQSDNIKGVNFTCMDYRDMDIPDESLIYCDPPYAGTQGSVVYYNKFNHDEFWGWCREKRKEGHTVFISEYDAPQDFICLTEIQHKTKLNKNREVERVEKLYTLY